MNTKSVLKESINNSLNPKLWNGDQLKVDVRERLDDIVNEFLSGLLTENIPIDVIDTHLVGSNASFNYTDKSDLDIHIIANLNDYEGDEKILQILYNYYKASFNRSYDIKIKGIDVELYIEDLNSSSISNGVYSLNQDKWLKFPQKMSIPDVDISKQLNIWLDMYRTAIQGNMKAKDLLNNLYILRKMSIAIDGEYGEGNLVFKEFRNRGYIDELKDIIQKQRSEELTLERLGESKMNKLILEEYEDLVTEFDQDIDRAYAEGRKYIGKPRQVIRDAFWAFMDKVPNPSKLTGKILKEFQKAFEEGTVPDARDEVAATTDKESIESHVGAAENSNKLDLNEMWDQIDVKEPTMTRNYEYLRNNLKDFERGSETIHITATYSRGKQVIDVKFDSINSEVRNAFENECTGFSFSGEGGFFEYYTGPNYETDGGADAIDQRITTGDYIYKIAKDLYQNLSNIESDFDLYLEAPMQEVEW